MIDLSFNGKKAESYAEAVLYCLANHGNGQIHIEKDIEPALAAGKIDFNRNRVTNAISNFKRLGLVEKVKDFTFSVNHSKANQVADNYSKGKCGLWIQSSKKSPSKIEKSVGKQYSFENLKTKASFYVRSILVAHKKVLAISDIVEIASKKSDIMTANKVKLTYKAIAMFLYNNKDAFNSYPSGKAYKLFGPNAYFFKKFGYEKVFYIQLFPEKKDFILERFNEALAPSSKKSIEDLRYTRTVVVRAILAAYPKPLTYKNIAALADRFGYEVNVTFLYAFRNRFDEYLEKINKGMHQIFIRANDKFFVKFVPEIESYVDLLENRKEQIYSRFNQEVPQLAKAHEKAHQENFDETIEEDRPAPDTDNGVEIEMDEQITAADVGASIISYVEKLKSALKKRQAVDVITRDEKDHIKSLNEKIFELRTAQTNLTTQNEKYAAIIKAKDNALQKLESELSIKANQISKLEIKLERTIAGRSTFNMSEVAKISSLVKGKKNSNPLDNPLPEKTLNIVHKHNSTSRKQG